MRISYSRMGQPDASIFDRPVEVVRIGSDSVNDIVLSNPHVSPRHAVISRTGAHWEITPLGENDILIGNQTLRYGERAVISLREPVSIFPFLLTFDMIDDSTAAKSQKELLDERLSEVVLAVHGDLLSRLEVDDTDETRRESESFLTQLEADIDELARLRGFLDESSGNLVLHSAAHTVEGLILSRIIEGSSANKVWGTGGKWTKLFTASPELERELEALASLLDRIIDPDRISDISEKMERVAAQFDGAWAADLKSKNLDGSNSFLQYLAKRYLKNRSKTSSSDTGRSRI